MWLPVTAMYHDSILHSHTVFTKYLGISDTKQTVPLYILLNKNNNIVYLQG